MISLKIKSIFNRKNSNQWRSLILCRFKIKARLLTSPPNSNLITFFGSFWRHIWICVSSCPRHSYLYILSCREHDVDILFIILQFLTMILSQTSRVFSDERSFFAFSKSLRHFDVNFLWYFSLNIKFRNSSKRFSPQSACLELTL